MIRNKQKPSGEATVILSIRIPLSLKDRIDGLAQKAFLTRNGWIINRLAKATKWSSTNDKSQ